MKPSRRKFLFGGAAAVATIPLGYALRVSLGGYSHQKTFAFLTSKEAVVFEKLTEAVIPPQNAFGISPNDLNIAGQFDDFMRISSAPERSEMRILLWVVEHVLPATKWQFRKFTELALKERLQILEGFENSTKTIPKLLSRAMKTLACFMYFNTPELQEKLGIKGWCGP